MSTPPSFAADAAPLPPLARGDRAARSLPTGRLTDLLRRVAAFGVTLARLDIRQDSARHTEALTAITAALGLGSYAEWDEPARLAFLLRELRAAGRSFPTDLDADAGGARRARHVPDDRARARRDRSAPT